MTALLRSLVSFLLGLAGLFLALLALTWVAETGGWVRLVAGAVIAAAGVAAALVTWDSADA